MHYDVRDTIRGIISDHGFIQSIIAKKAGITPSKFSAILNKHCRLAANEMFSICSAMGVEPDELWKRNISTDKKAS